MLRPDTQKLWDRLRDERALAGFVLIGGSALSLRFGHRLSEDLDLAFIGPGPEPALRLPGRLLDQVLAVLRSEGWPVEARDSAVSWQEFEVAGQDLHDYQQDYLIGQVRVTFFTPETPLCRLIGPGVTDGVRLASADELFRSKALATAGRSKTRDWFDLHHLMTVGGYSMADFVRAFEEAREPSKLGIAFNRLCSGQPGLGDEGFVTLLPEPPSIAELTRYFMQECSRVEVASAVCGFGKGAQTDSTAAAPPLRADNSPHG